MNDQYHWAYDAVFYHIYPLGFCGAPACNDFNSQTMPRLEKIKKWIPHLLELQINALYLGPVFESTAHGYDTANYFRVDRRLGDNQALVSLISELHQNNIRVILDGVFNHVGRDFWAFQDIKRHRQLSPYCGWFLGLDFNSRSRYGDPFTYEGWNGHYDLVKLNLHSPDVKAHLFQAVRTWIQDFDIDGLRLDVADSLDPQFMRDLRTFTKSIRSDFWLMGEVVHGDYRDWANAEMLDSVTNYECYKGLYSSLVDKNYFEIAYSLKRQFGEVGLYRNLPLYNFADNHDVDRVATSLQNPAYHYPLYCLLFTMPGVPSIYYGSEWGLCAERLPHDDSPLRPSLDLETISVSNPQPALKAIITKLAAIRHATRALRYGDYLPLHVNHLQLGFARQVEDECVIVILNAADKPISLDVSLPIEGKRAIDLLNTGDEFSITGHSLEDVTVFPHWARVLQLER